ncbi:hypothetical protein BO94DRAFT_575153 [Aspergillus sclerotioniger CBS 115572]|uniref:NACHT domain-containing protein n=1 Tax=Aspergillus sclerotioniger CBS 115572 TaxID=1450535 RepID=A0A317WP11_9EURO|nr:hypothetical protein BO94DRAFT_575153 [Aspergillus sclerotioniger CBS 115572]PWY88133.1 hypothetical protein BO94DRAFT_575153 [Aspergillus sclerotioniger CBS 115572]
MDPPDTDKPRPTEMQDLIKRLRELLDDSKEKDALFELVERMVQLFEDNRKTSYWTEASELGFTNLIAEHAGDGTELNNRLLTCFAHAIRRKQFLSAENTSLATALNGLSARLKLRVDLAQKQKQYELLCMLGTVLDAMADIKVSGITREYLHGPLLKQLGKLRESKEPRLAQAASYAYQALRCVPDDESRWQAFCRYSWTLLEATGKISGAVTTLDPTKAIDAGSNVKELLELYKRIVEAVGDVSTACRSLNQEILHDLDKLPKANVWYTSLRYSKLLIEAGALQILRELIGDLPGSHDAQYYWEKRIVEFIDWTMSQERVQVVISKSSPVQQWLELVAETMEQPHWIDQPVAERFRLDPRRWVGTARHAPRVDRHKSLERTSQPRVSLFCQHQTSAQRTAQDLLETAWESCIGAQRFYADRLIRRVSTSPKRLSIIRLSGTSHTIEQSYIDLVVVKSSGERNGTSVNTVSRRQTNLSILEPPNISSDGIKKTNEVALSKLFSLRTHTDNTVQDTRRILITGQAGVGKTTLCNKIIHNYYHNQMWADKFDRIILIPLRQPKRGLDVWDVLKQEYLSREKEVDLFFSAIRRTIFDTDHRTLLLIDGLDEASGETVSGSLWALLNFPNVIVTSRPYAVSSLFQGHTGLFDLELETTGFGPSQVDLYLEMVEENPETRRNMQGFIHRHWPIQALLQIPIQLDAFCVAWGHPDLSPDTPMTLACLYDVIERKLWSNDIATLPRTDWQWAVGEIRPQNCRTHKQIEAVVGEGLHLEQALAFNGLYNNVVEFSEAHRDAVHELFQATTDNILERVSFLRTSDGVRHASQTFHFIHLTFRDYFAARYFIRCWTENQPLRCIGFGSSGKPSVSHVSTEALICTRKYHPRYDIMWRFVAGILHQSDPNGHSAVEGLRRKLESSLLAVVRYDGPPSSIISESEFPDHIEKEILTTGAAEHKLAVLFKLPVRTHMSAGLLDCVEHCLAASNPMIIRPKASQILGMYAHVAPGKALRALFQTDADVAESALAGLSTRSDLNIDVCASLVNLLVSKKGSPMILRSQRNLPGEIITHLQQLLVDCNPCVRQRAVEALSTQVHVSHQIKCQLVNCLDDCDRLVRIQVMVAIQGWKGLSTEVLGKVVSFTLHGDDDEVCCAARLLDLESDLLPDVVQQLTFYLKQEASDSYSGLLEILVPSRLRVLQIAGILAKKGALSIDLVQILLLGLSHEVDFVRYTAAALLGYQAIKSRPLFDCLIDTFRDTSETARQSAIYALLPQRALPQHVLRSLVHEFLDDANSLQLALSALSKQIFLPEDIVRTLQSKATQICSHDLWHSVLLSKILGKDPGLPTEDLKRLLPVLAGDSPMNRESAVPVLQRDAHMHTLSAACVFYGKGRLPPHIVRYIISLLHKPDPHWFYPEWVLRRPEFYDMLPSLDKETWKLWFGKIWQMSFREPITCHVWEGHLYLNFPQGSHRVRLQMNDLEVKLPYVIKMLENKWRHLEPGWARYQPEGLAERRNVLDLPIR